MDKKEPSNPHTAKAHEEICLLGCCCWQSITLRNCCGCKGNGRTLLSAAYHHASGGQRGPYNRDVCPKGEVGGVTYEASGRGEGLACKIGHLKLTSYFTFRNLIF